MKIGDPYIEITNRCNLNCRDCYNSSGLNRETEELSPETLEAFLTLLHDRYQVDFAHFSGGEPLLHSRFHDILEMTERLTAFRFLFITNGVCRDDFLYDLLERDKRFYVQFSVDGMDEEAHSQMRGSGNWAKTIANLKSLKPINPPVCKMVVTPFNAHQVEEFFLFVRELGGVPAFSYPIKQGNASTNWSELNLSVYQKIAVAEKIEKWKKQYSVEEYMQVPHPTTRCPLADESEPVNFCIKANGDILPCQGLYDSHFKIGSVYSFSTEEIEEQMRDLRDKLAARIQLDYGCERCINRDKCGKGCGAMAYFLHQDLFASDGECDYRRLSTAKLVFSSCKDKL